MEMGHKTMTKDTVVGEVVLTEVALTEVVQINVETEAGVEEVKAIIKRSSVVGPGMSEAGIVMLKVIIPVCDMDV